MEVIFINGVKKMPISASAQISFPLDIPQVDVLATKQTQDGKFIITVESRKETTKYGVCKQVISCNYGHGQEIGCASKRGKGLCIILLIPLN